MARGLGGRFGRGRRDGVAMRPVAALPWCCVFWRQEGKTGGRYRKSRVKSTGIASVHNPAAVI